MLRRTGFGNCNDIAAADRPGERHGGRRAIMCCAETGKYGITRHAGTSAAGRRIGHNRYTVLLAPGQQVALDVAAGRIVEDLIGRAAVAVRNTEEVFHGTDVKVRDAPGTDLPCAAQSFE